MSASTRPCGAAQARGHLQRARAYLELAELAQDDQAGEQARASVGNAVLAGIAAGDAICCARGGVRSSSTNHMDAVRLLRRVTGDRGLAKALRELIDMKNEAHYGLDRFNRDRNTAAVRRARALVEAAEEACS